MLSIYGNVHHYILIRFICVNSFHLLSSEKNLLWHIVDVKGAFLHGEFENGEQIYTTIPEGFEQWHDPNIWVWLLTKTIYGLEKAAVQFWKTLLRAMTYMRYKKK